MNAVRVRELGEQETADYAAEERLIRDPFMDRSTVKRTMPNGKQFGNVYKVLGAEYRKEGKLDWEAHARRLGTSLGRDRARPPGTLA